MTLLEGIVDSIEVTPDRQAGLDYALSKLTEVEQEVLKLRFQERLTYDEIGKVRGKTGHSACGTENNAMRKLRRTTLHSGIFSGCYAVWDSFLFWDLKLMQLFYTA